MGNDQEVAFVILTEGSDSGEAPQSGTNSSLENPIAFHNESDKLIILVELES